MNIEAQQLYIYALVYKIYIYINLVIFITYIIIKHNNHIHTYKALGNTPGQPAGVNINKLLWDPYLAKVAQDYSTNCQWLHNSNRNTDLQEYQNNTEYKFDSYSLSVGENLFYTTSNDDILTNLLYGIQSYYNEYEYFTFNNNTDGCCQNDKMCGHYTQVIWSNTRYVGCGYTICDGLSGTSIGSGTNVLLKVCNYFPSGNIVGNSPYFSGCACSNCPFDRICNENGLCAGCGSLNYDFCDDYYSNCDLLGQYCPNGCSTSSDNQLCVGCRSTCSTCSESMLAARDNCTDGTNSDLQGNFDGRNIVTPNTKSIFTGSPYCDGSNTITDCSADP